MQNLAKPKYKQEKVVARPSADKKSSQSRPIEYPRVSAVAKKSLQVREIHTAYKAAAKKPKKTER